MTGSLISGTVTATVTIGAGGYGSPLTIASTGEVAPTAYSTDGIDAPASLGTLSIANYGRVFAANGYDSANGGVGINLLATATISNSGQIRGGGSAYDVNHYPGIGGAGIYLGAGGSIDNSGIIVGGGSAQYLSTSCGNGVDLAAGGTLVNSGTIESGEGLGQGGVAVVFGQPGVLTNTGTIVAAQGASHHGFDYTRGCDGGVAIEAAGGALSNTGTIAGGSGGYGQHAGYGGVGIILSNSGMLTNQGLILGGEGGGGGQDRPGVGGVGLDMGPGGSASNDGTITGGAGGVGRYSGNAGSGGDGVNMQRGVLDNASVIAGGNGGFGYSVGGTGGVGIDVSGGTLTDTGSISGGAGGAAGQDAYVAGRGGNGGAGVYLNGGVLMDAGTISGGAAGIGPGGNGVAGDAVLFGTLAGELVLQAHAVLDGAVAADPTVDDVLILAGKSAASIAAPVTGFTNVDERANARWTVTGELQAATITLAGGILIDSASGTIVAGTRTNAEAGTILVSQGGTLVGPGTIGAPQVIDDGKLDAHGGTLTVKGSLSSYGTVRIDSNATLVEKGTLSVTHVAFGLNGDAHLVVAQPIPQSQATPTFYAFGAGDTIALQHLQANSLDFANGTLSLQDAGVTVDTLLFSGDYSSANFTLTSDGNGGTVLSYVPDKSHMPHFAFLQHW